MKKEIIKSKLKKIGIFFIEIAFMVLIIYLFKKNNFIISLPSMLLGVVLVHSRSIIKEIFKKQSQEPREV